MASLKEIKQRISSVQGTKKVTSAMKMVSSAKLHKAQGVVTGMVPYQRALDFIVANFLEGDMKIDSPFVHTPDAESSNKEKHIAIVVFSSNSSLCGPFNYNVIKEFVSVVAGVRNVDVYPIGKKVEEAVVKMGFRIAEVEDYKAGDYQHLAAKPSAKGAEKIARHLMREFEEGRLEKVLLIYQHFKSAGVQVVTKETLLPLDLEELKKRALANAELKDKKYLHNYIVEPSVEEVIRKLLPQVVIQKLYTALADSFASEHAARTVAMQVATDNAEDLIGELTILYNKSRQSAITAELLDIIAGSTQ